VSRLPSTASVWRVIAYPWHVVMFHIRSRYPDIECDALWRDRTRQCDALAGNYLCDRWIAAGARVRFLEARMLIASSQYSGEVVDTQYDEETQADFEEMGASSCHDELGTYYWGDGWMVFMEASWLP